MRRIPGLAVALMLVWAWMPRSVLAEAFSQPQNVASMFLKQIIGPIVSSGMGIASPTDNQLREFYRTWLYSNQRETVTEDQFVRYWADLRGEQARANFFKQARTNPFLRYAPMGYEITGVAFNSDRTKARVSFRYWRTRNTQMTGNMFTGLDRSILAFAR